MKKTVCILVLLALCTGCKIPFMGNGSEKPKRPVYSKIDMETDTMGRNENARNRRTKQEPTEAEKEAEEERRKREFAYASNEQGAQLTARGEYRKAIQRFSAAIKQVSNEPAFFINLGRTLYLMGDYNRALAAYKSASKMNVKSDQRAVLMANIADVYRQREQYSTATSYYNLALKAQPNFARVHYELGNMYLKQRKFESAEFRLNKAIVLDPNYKQAYIARIILYHLTQRYAKALSDVKLLERQGYEIDPSLRLEILRGYENEKAGRRFKPAG